MIDWLIVLGYISTILRKQQKGSKMKIQTKPETTAEIRAIMEQNPDEPQAIRVFLAGMGWSGPSWGLALDEQKDEDILYEEDGVKFLMEESVYEQFGEFTVEYTDHGYIVAPTNSQPSDGCASCAGSCS